VADVVTTSPEELASALRKWAATQDGHRRAAVELLIGHGYWLGREDFTDEPICGPVRRSHSETWIDWQKARGFSDSSLVQGASTSQIAVLRFAAALGLDLYRLNFTSDEEAAAAVRAVATATGMERMLRA
jgi:hypothetical protein